MKILVCLKRVIDYNVRVQLSRDGDGVATDGVKMSINPFDEIALEESLRLRESDAPVSEIVVASIGTDACQQQLRTGLAMGADRAIHIRPSADESVQPLYAARAFRALVERESFDLVLMGKQAIDDDNNQTGQMLAAIWDRPQATFTSELKLDHSASPITARCTREVDAGLETLEIDLPAVITTDLRLNEPRYVKMPDIMKAKRKPLDVIELSELSVEAPPALTVSAHEAPPARSAGRRVADVDELLSALRERGALS
jgi:electron transfer flavoprotein beta subunit